MHKLRVQPDDTGGKWEYEMSCKLQVSLGSSVIPESRPAQLDEIRFHYET